MKDSIFTTSFEEAENRSFEDGIHDLCDIVRDAGWDRARRIYHALGQGRSELWCQRWLSATPLEIEVVRHYAGD